MFGGIKLLCITPKKDFTLCLNPVIVPNEKYFKISLEQFKCLACGRTSQKVMPFFSQLIKLRKSVDDIDKTGFLYKGYNLGFEIRYKGEDSVIGTPYFLDNDDWGHWNMQICSITLKNIEHEALNFDVWEDHFYKANTCLNPKVRKFRRPITFNWVLRTKSFYYQDKEVKRLDTLKNFLREIRRYNIVWRSLFDYSLLNAVPVDLTCPRYTGFENVKSLAELFPDIIYD